MNEHTKIRPAQVIGPLGEALTIDSLPPPGTRRWVVRRKAEVVAAVTGGLLSIEEACERYDLSLEEFMQWQESLRRSGILGLRVTSVQHYRTLYARQDAADADPAQASEHHHGAAEANTSDSDVQAKHSK